MFGLGAWEIVVIATTALIVLGPERLPIMLRQLARIMGELRRVADEVRGNFDDVMAEPARPADTKPAASPPRPSRAALPQPTVGEPSQAQQPDVDRTDSTPTERP